MDKKRSVGVTMFAIFIIVIGINQIIMPISMLFAHIIYAPSKLSSSYKNLAIRLAKADNYLRQHEKEYDAEKYNKLNQTFTQLKQALADFKKNYIYNIPYPLKIFVLFSLLSGILFIYTGIVIFKLNSSFRIFLSLSLIAGLSNNLAFFWHFSAYFFPLVRIANLARMSVAIKHSATSPHMNSFSDILKITFFHPNVVICFIVYFVFVLISIYFFTRPTVKEQFR